MIHKLDEYYVPHRTRIALCAGGNRRRGLRECGCKSFVLVATCGQPIAQALEGDQTRPFVSARGAQQMVPTLIAMQMVEEAPDVIARGNTLPGPQRFVPIVEQSSWRIAATEYGLTALGRVLFGKMKSSSADARGHFFPVTQYARPHPGSFQAA